MNGSILFHNLSESELNIYLEILSTIDGHIPIKDLLEKIGKTNRYLVIELAAKGFIIKKDNRISLPKQKSLLKLLLSQEYKFRSNQYSLEGENNYLTEIKSYLGTVQKQVTHVETQSRKAFLNLRIMVDKITDQGKEHISNAFDKVLDRNSETGEWISIPHISPVGLYAPINDLKSKFKVIINELENSLHNLMVDYTDKVETILEDTNDNKTDNTISRRLENDRKEILNDSKNFSEEVLIAMNEQINLLETNLAKDLMRQFDAIERLNDLKPERIWIMLEESRSEITLYLNSIYSRILKEINTLQIQVDISNVSLILTNEAGKAIKKVDQIQKESFSSLKPLSEILEKLEE